MNNGLSHTEAAKRLLEHGYNELSSSESKSILNIALEVVKEPMFILLMSCSILYIIIGDYTEGIILTSWVFIIIFITFYQHQKTEKAVNALKKLSSPRALVIRDGKEVRIAGREVVPGDLLILNEGDRVPADGELTESLNLSIDESLLTGESVPVLKDENGTNNNVFSGTLVVQGKGFVNVKNTGTHTEFGKIGRSLEQIDPDQTRLQKEMKVLIRNLFIAGAFLSIIVIIAFYVTRGSFIQSLLNGLAAAMAMLPEEFPVVLTVFLALGAWRLSQKNVLTRKPSAIESLGSATVLCSDKTGTITQNKMEIVGVFTKEKIINKNELNEHSKDLNEIFKIAFSACQKDTIDPMEKAIVNSYSKTGIDKETAQILIKEYPLNKDLFAMTRVLKKENGHLFEVFCKGAPEAVLTLCKIESEKRAALLSIVQQMAEKGQRILGVAKATHEENKTLPENQKGFSFEFVGFLGFEDPIRPEVPAAIKECHEAGIKVIMITGDYPSTAQIGMGLKFSN